MSSLAWTQVPRACPTNRPSCAFATCWRPHELGLQILASVNATLAAKGLILKTGSSVDATLIAASSSTKNSTGTRDPEMHQTKKGNQWYFGMKGHIAADA